MLDKFNSTFGRGECSHHNTKTSILPIHPGQANRRNPVSETRKRHIFYVATTSLVHPTAPFGPSLPLVTQGSSRHWLPRLGGEKTPVSEDIETKLTSGGDRLIVITARVAAVQAPHAHCHCLCWTSRWKLREVHRLQILP